MKIFSFGFRVRRVTEESERRQQLGETTGGGEGGRENGLGVGVYVYLFFFPEMSIPRFFLNKEKKTHQSGSPRSC